MIMKEILKITDMNHYLAKSNINYDKYVADLKKIVNSLSTKTTPKKIKDLITSKLQISDRNFNETQYIQAACELTAMGKFLEYPDIQFIYEDKITPPKDVDFSIVKNGRKINIEVKCASYKKEDKNPETIKLAFTNRMPTIEIKNDIANEITERLSNYGKAVEEEKNLDNTLKDFLISTQGKTANRQPNDINILIICCDDALDMQNWYWHLLDNNGYFTPKSRVPHKEYNNVDMVLLTNIYNRHFKYYDEPVITKHWEIDSSFNLLISNRFSTLSYRTNPVAGKKILSDLNEIFPNHSIEFQKYMNDKNDVPPGENFLMKNILGITWFSDKFKSNGIYYFRR